MRAVFQSYDDVLPHQPPIFAAYLKQDPAVMPFFAYHPFDQDAYTKRAAWLDRNYPGNREAVADALVQYNERLRAAPQALENAAKLRDPNALVVITGQQPGLLGGPLFTLYKAVTAIRFAGQLSERLSRPVVPLFWIASEDHDFDEVRFAPLLDRRGRIRTLAAPPLSRARIALGHLPPPRQGSSFLREVAQAVDVAPGGRRLLDEAEAALADAESWADWFARLMAQWLSRFGLVMVDPLYRPLRAALKDFFPVALIRKGGIDREVAAAADKLKRRGFEPALSIDASHSHVFMINERGERIGLHWHDGTLRDREQTLQLSSGEAATLMRKQPWSFSPNVILRPIAQDLLFPTLAMVCGPGEISYLAQLRDVYPFFGLEMPILLPRLSLTVATPEVQALLEKYPVGVGTFLAGDPQAILQNLLNDRDPVGIDAMFARLRDEIERAYAGLASPLATISPALEEIRKRNFERVQAQVSYLHKKTLQHHRRAQRSLVRDFHLLSNTLRPNKQLQERFFSALPWLARFGTDFLDALQRGPLLFEHQVVLIEQRP